MSNPTPDTEIIRSDDVAPPPDWSSVLIGLAILTLCVLFGSIYIWKRIHTPPLPPPPSLTRINNEPETVRANADVSNLETLSPSDELDFIEADLLVMPTDTTEADLSAIEAELIDFETKVKAP